MAYFSEVDIDVLAVVIEAELKNFSEEVTECIKEEVKEVAKQCAKDIKSNAPEDSGDYKKGWKARVAYESKSDIRMEVYNSKKPTLAHLLEYGHAKKNGGKVEGKPHIRPAAQQAEKKLLEKARVGIGGISYR